MKTKLLMLVFSILALASYGQAEMADTFRSEGKIYVVLAVILVIVFALIFLLIRSDRKLDRIEKQLGNK